jgi:hypothetical protein
MESDYPRSGGRGGLYEDEAGVAGAVGAVGVMGA